MGIKEIKAWFDGHDDIYPYCAKERAIDLIRIVEELEDAYGVLEAKADFDSHLLEKAQARVAELEAQVDAYTVPGVHNCPICKVNYAYWQNKAEQLQEQVDRVKALPRYAIDYELQKGYVRKDGDWVCADELERAIKGESDD